MPVTRIAPDPQTIKTLGDEIEEFMQQGLPRVDPKTGHLYLTNGNCIPTKEISSLRLMRVFNNRAGEPKEPQPPLKPMTYAGGITREEPDPSDPEFLTAHAVWEEEYQAWESQSRLRLVMFVITEGIDLLVPEEFETNARVIDPYITPLGLRYDYYCSLIPNDDIEWAVQALVGRSIATEEGVEEAHKFFPGDRQ